MPDIIYNGHTYKAANSVTLNQMQQAVFASQSSSLPAAWTFELTNGDQVTIHVGAAPLVFFEPKGQAVPQKIR